jgi:hypothetical protein
MGRQVSYICNSKAREAWVVMATTYDHRIFVEHRHWVVALRQRHPLLQWSELTGGMDYDNSFSVVTVLKTRIGLQKLKIVRQTT